MSVVSSLSLPTRDLPRSAHAVLAVKHPLPSTRGRFVALAFTIGAPSSFDLDAVPHGHADVGARGHATRSTTMSCFGGVRVGDSLTVVVHRAVDGRSDRTMLSAAVAVR